MANVDRPNGFKLIGNTTGVIPPAEKMVATASATIYPGDLVKRVAAGTVETGAANDGEIIVGVAAEYVSAAASGETNILVHTDINNLYEVQADTGSALTSACRGATANHVATAGDSTYKQSRQELDSSDVGTGAQLLILDKVDTPDNAWGEHVKLIVRLNESTRKYPVAGI